MSWLGFAGVFGLFCLTHSIPVRPPVKSRIVAVTGTRGFGLCYSILSIVMLSVLIWAAGQAPSVQLWPQMSWHRAVVQVGMLAVCLILAFAIARPNPFSFGGAHNDRFDPARAGIVRLTRHPILLALALWAALHLLPNGDLAHVLLFGVLGGFATLGRGLINRRKKRQMGGAKWRALNEAVADAPVFYMPPSIGGAALRLGAGILGFVALILLHPAVIGVAVM